MKEVSSLRGKGMVALLIVTGRGQADFPDMLRLREAIRQQADQLAGQIVVEQQAHQPRARPISVGHAVRPDRLARISRARPISVAGVAASGSARTGRRVSSGRSSGTLETFRRVVSIQERRPRLGPSPTCRRRHSDEGANDWAGECNHARAFTVARTIREPSPGARRLRHRFSWDSARRLNRRRRSGPVRHPRWLSIVPCRSWVQALS